MQFCTKTDAFFPKKDLRPPKKGNKKRPEILFLTGKGIQNRKKTQKPENFSP